MISAASGDHQVIMPQLHTARKGIVPSNRLQHGVAWLFSSRADCSSVICRGSPSGVWDRDWQRPGTVPPRGLRGSKSDSCRKTVTWMTAFSEPSSSRKKPASWRVLLRDAPGSRRVSKRLKTDSSRRPVGLVQKAELAVVSHVDHGLGLPGKNALEERAVERLEDGGDLEVISTARAAMSGANRTSRQNPACFKDMAASRRGAARCSSNRPAPQVFIEHDVEALLMFRTTGCTGWAILPGRRRRSGGRKPGRECDRTISARS